MRRSGSYRHLQLKREWRQLGEGLRYHAGRRGQKGCEGHMWGGHPCWCGELLWLCVAMVGKSCLLVWDGCPWWPGDTVSGAHRSSSSLTCGNQDS